tara:strand:- start:9103 stop:9621 length:519 start_codon:yes stop_codon:yes gene_type:complete
MWAILVVVILYLVGAHKTSSQIHKKFGLAGTSYELISTDLGKMKSHIRLSRYGVNGIPDAVFQGKKKKVIIVGEFKSRKHKKVVRLYEFYQLTLYLGHIQARYPDHAVKGLLAYADGVVAISYDKDVYSGLLQLSKELRAARASNKIPDSRPLHRRMKVSSQNRALTFSTDK